ncbi:hypothetical protein NIES2135_34310 [Leptolyngbya boryana NIES-2135]|jgi:hypothetical protein|uniref:Uncharacterized protein n=1 Tax=Leptolyngbya boryana NIES-2135 TaxID=1973484 RepID=A0A1Z4JJ69_LEPBY|nr:MULTISPECIES: hypothetical protein [Leptolyngbya]BAY56597.1 hypothetical protein NIES2135_34310 [Leptolyngbya boryana NIES-2135]MBD2369899.1 hypothetical protein [Leptolyngbya sp. FACHB-161]MBD2376156.1 hypothetical protein [Leptolyngbya sp. FACHB-238]MBD2400431.1 hypothetical protein [Leptolyngbya sp. FACHB-239]MBD2406973.1 hypothetical protein [Leptolyngbya sp. FACHB-402]
MRATIKAYQRDYVRQIGSLMGTDDPTEIISRIISDHQMRLLGVSVPEIQNDAVMSQGNSSEVDESLLGLLG